jgi:hypothetical protein
VPTVPARLQGESGAIGAAYMSASTRVITPTPAPTVPRGAMGAQVRDDGGLIAGSHSKYARFLSIVRSLADQARPIRYWL